MIGRNKCAVFQLGRSRNEFYFRDFAIEINTSPIVKGYFGDFTRKLFSVKRRVFSILDALSAFGNQIKVFFCNRKNHPDEVCASRLSHLESKIYGLRLGVEAACVTMFAAQSSSQMIFQFFGFTTVSRNSRLIAYSKSAKANWSFTAINRKQIATSVSLRRLKSRPCQACFSSDLNAAKRCMFALYRTINAFYQCNINCLVQQLQMVTEVPNG